MLAVPTDDKGMLVRARASKHAHLSSKWGGSRGLHGLKDQSVLLSNPLHRPLFHVFVGSSASREQMA